MKLSEFQTAVDEEFGAGYGSVVVNDLVLAASAGAPPARRSPPACRRARCGSRSARRRMSRPSAGTASAGAASPARRG